MPNPIAVHNVVGDDAVVADDSDGDALAARQLRAAWSDPRLARARGAHVADFFDYLEEANRVLMLANGAISEMRDPQSREAARLAGDADDPGAATDREAALEAARERAELAAAEVHNQHPHLHALTLIGIHGNLDGLVESLTPALHEMRAATVAAQMLDNVQADPAHAELFAGTPPESVEAIRDALAHVMVDRMPSFKWGNGRGESGAERWEAPLRAAGLGAPHDRPIPADLDAALGELSALRDVLVHRAGRVDERALRKWPGLTRLGLDVGDFVRIDRRLYRRYIAAVRCYGTEVVRRLFAGAVPGFDVDLARWEGYAPLLA